MTLQHKHIVLKLFTSALALFSLYAGWNEARKLAVLLLPASAFQAINGSIVKVERHIDQSPGHAAKTGATQVLFKITFSYVLNGIERTVDSASPICTYCEISDIKRFSGKTPMELNPETRVTVFVLEKNRDTAFLELPTKAAALRQLMFTLIWLIVLPAFIFCFCYLWTRDAENSSSNGA